MAAPEPKEIRESYADYRNDWQAVYDDADEDMRAISPSGPWTQEDRAAREDSGRPCVHLDQINQYLNQTIGNVRKNKRAVKAMPKGNGANDEDAKRRSSLIMGIEERSQAQPIYLYAFECQIQRSLGFAVIRTEYRDDSTFDQDILIKPVPNPRTVLFSPYFKQPDASDVPEAFLIDRMTKAKYKEKYPDAKITDFTGEVLAGEHISDWVNEKTVQVCEFWKVEYERSKLILAGMPHGNEVFTEEEFKAMSEALFTSKGLPAPQVKRERTVETPRVMQYMTNGLEVLDEIQWAGTRIPIIACFGPERWINEGGTAKRQLLSMVRFARDPQMLFDFLATQECELAGMVPKTPFVGYKGQFESDIDAWKSVNRVPVSFLQADMVIDGANGQVLPLPQRADFSAPFQEYELAKDAASRHVQSSMGITPLPTAMQRRSEKSGVALEKIDDMESLGAFHFVDRYESCFLHNMGWQINELITPILDTKREMPVAQPDGSRTVMQIVGKTSHPIDEQGGYDVQGLPEDHFHTDKGEFDVTISTGPSYQSEREEQSAFVDQLIENMPNLPPPQTPGAKVLALAIRMRPDLGPIGQQIADVFDPPDPSNLPPQAQAVVAQLQGQLQQLEQENQALHMDRAGRVIEIQAKQQIEAMKADNALVMKKMDGIVQLLKAQLAAKSRSTDLEAQRDADMELAKLGLDHDQIDRAHEAAHELGMAHLQQENAKDLASHTAALQPEPEPANGNGPQV